MKKIKMLYLIVVLALLAISVVMFSGIAQAGAVPEGFMGVPWGASKDQVIKAMSEQGYRQFTNGQQGPDTLAFQGSFLGKSCILEFIFSGNSFYWGAANFCSRHESPAPSHAYFDDIVKKKLSEKYGPPDKQGSYPNLDANTPPENAVWYLVDNRSSDKYTIAVNWYFTYFSDTTVRQYVVDVDYTASSLEERLKKKNY